MPFPHKQVLITGATSGIGLALTERLLANKISVIAVARTTARLEALLAKHGPAHLAIEPLDVTDLASLPDWTARITATYPASSTPCPSGPPTTATATADVLAATTAELTTNYLAPLHTTLLFLPHLRAHAAAGRPAALYYVTSALALVPLPRCANYCASKAALRALAWQVRAQLRDEERQSGQDAVRVVEIVPPAVQTELHTRQGLAPIGMPLADFIDEMWVALESGEQDEILVGPAKEYAHIDDAKTEAFQQLLEARRGQEDEA
ncbi:hypothetical protein D7B24_006027 [Verticillium nonalfalfae]|uniref:Uncharacterized protein n=1 Tax=Verticillium nonalfalfae TaxID=1051616 RepID=A0A3M9YAL3_9PEZI|nr:uncharacterized protein D7B24_006027 [Verticillium nonalfalfae]RNJ57414.1 hypothetical protein D7B24_006027 [Verticillium nonalfalfae]